MYNCKVNYNIFRYFITVLLNFNKEGQVNFATSNLSCSIADFANAAMVKSTIPVEGSGADCQLGLDLDYIEGIVSKITGDHIYIEYKEGKLNFTSGRYNYTVRPIVDKALKPRATPNLPVATVFQIPSDLLRDGIDAVDGVYAKKDVSAIVRFDFDNGILVLRDRARELVDVTYGENDIKVLEGGDRKETISIGMDYAKAIAKVVALHGDCIVKMRSNTPMVFDMGDTLCVIAHRVDTDGQ